MLRRTLSSVSESVTIKSLDQENNFEELNLLPTPSPNRSKYEGKFGKRRPLQEKTNKLSNGVDTKERTKGDNCKNDNSDKSENSKSTNNTTNTNTNITNTTTGNTSFQDLFHLNDNSNTTATSHNDSTKVEELTLALSETLKENEELHDTVTLLKAEIERLNKELLENQEYAELYLLGKELIENQAEEIESLKKKLRA